MLKMFETSFNHFLFKLKENYWIAERVENKYILESYHTFFIGYIVCQHQSKQQHSIIIFFLISIFL